MVKLAAILTMGTFLVLGTCFLVSVASAIDVQVEVEVGKLYYFNADWCRVCKLQTPIIKRLQKDGFNFEIISDADPRVKEYNVTRYPTIIIETENRNVRLEGLQSGRKLRRILKEKE